MERARAVVSRAFVVEHFTQGPVSQSALFENEYTISMTHEHMRMQYGVLHFLSEDAVENLKRGNIVISNSVWSTYIPVTILIHLRVDIDVRIILMFLHLDATLPDN